MLIKIAKNGIESEWFQLTKKHHRTLLLEKPDVVFVHIDSLYPKSPESGQIVELSFPCFNLLAREFVLEENRQEKQNERHQDYRAVEDINPRENGALMTSLEEIYLRQEIKRILNGPSNVLTDLQQRRLRLFLDGYTLTRIGEIEGISHTAARKSVFSAIEKIKNTLNDGFKKALFCRIK